MYLLDTNHCAQLRRADPEVTARVASLRETGIAIATCAIVRGELIHMAHNSANRVANLAAVESLLGDMIVYPADEAAADVYGVLKVALLDRFGPRERRRRRQYDVTRLGFSENDLWIASIAKCRRLTIVSSDSDFARIAEVDQSTVETWWSPQLGGVTQP